MYRKMGLWRTGGVLATLGAMVVLSGFSLSAYAESALDRKLDVVAVEAEPPLAAVAGKERDTLRPVAASRFVSDNAVLSDKQVAPYIAAALSGFAERQIAPPDGGYTVNGTFDEAAGEVLLVWYPTEWEALGPLHDVAGSAYTAKFADANPQEGTGTLSALREIPHLRITKKADAPQTMTLSF